MDAVEYTKTLSRLCESQANCPECPLHENCAWLRRRDEVYRGRSQESTYHRPGIHAAYGALDKR